MPIQSLAKYFDSFPADPDDDELGGPHGRDSDVTNEPAVIDVVLSHGSAIALHREGFVRRRAHQRPPAPHSEQEVRDAARDSSPRGFVVRLKYDPLCAFVNRFFDEQEETANDYVLPLGFTRHRTRAPYAYASAVRTKITNYIDAPRIENVMLVFVNRVLQRATIAW